ncbi:MAG: hypothetical protein L7T84_15360 [Akkermansiaceae bacterium]|nr:hypothetical protein [Akkermansiaceae bacterium]
MKKTTSKKQFTMTALLGLFVVGAASAVPTKVDVPVSITEDTVWDSDTDDDGIIDQIFHIDTAVFVGDLTGATRPTLTITPGTVIAASGSTTGTNGLDVGTLVITRDGKIDAAGTAENPIVFTSVEEAEFIHAIDIDGVDGINTTKPDPVVDGGLWGGVIILGNAPINFYDSATNNLGENSVEGFATNAAGDNILYGGNDPGDNSGILRYASLRFGGFEFALDEEINGLTMGGVGAGTTIDHIEVVGNTDDGFEWFGGTVNTSHLFALYCQDESFDLDEGHQGTHQFWFAVQSNFSDYGTEADGGNKTGAGVKTGNPMTLAKVYNATYVGAPDANDAFRLKDNYAGQFHNSIFSDIGDNLVRIDDTDTAGQVGVNLKFTNNIFGTPGNAQTHGGQPVQEAALIAQTGNATDTDPMFTTLGVNGDGEVNSIDPRPAAASPAWGGSLTAGAPSSVSYKGAFGANNWLSGWSYGSTEGIVVDDFVAPAITIEEPPAAITADTVWDSDTNDDGILDKIYFVDQAIFVGNLTGATRPTLTIEPGTLIACSGSTTGTNGLDVGTLVITRDGQLDAQGELNSPIVFTSVAEAEYLHGVDIDGADGVNDVKQDPVIDGGAWGGVVILGRAPINFFDSATNNLGENSVEGFATNAAGDSILYGGSDPADNSGILTYASLRFGGFEFALDEEINGLTMGGVGAGTTINHVEVVGNTDDGFEWFGGTVNTSHLFALYCQDESFDLDEGHQGTHQFWFAVQSNFSDYGTEADGGNKTGAGVKTGEPMTLAKIFNATYVGAPDANDAFRLKDNFAGQFHNSIFTEIGDDLVRIDDTDTSGQVGGHLLFTNNIFGTPGDVEVHGGQPTEEAALLAQAGNVKDTDPAFSAVGKNDDGEVILIDPRPALTGPAWGTTLTAGAQKVAPFRGAFGAENWAKTWTYASTNGLLVDAFALPEQIEIVALPAAITADTTWDSDSNGDGLVDRIYSLSAACFVGDLTGATRPILTIAPGTVIAASGSTTGTNGLDVGTLVITRDGAISADGEPTNPIVFTSVAEAEYLYGIDIDGVDGINSVKQDPIIDGGAWGGVILLGHAGINFYDSEVNNLNENSIEGFATNAAGDNILYGGGNDGDSSGSLSYASIRFGGFEFALDEEINGLTMGGVGSGTSIHHVEVVGNTDDGFEWFGGTVSTSHLFALYCQDECFDLDEGHQGNHQFWFAVQSNFSDYGTEADGGNKTGAGVKTGEPKTLAKVYNATYVGAPDANDAFRLKDNYSGQFHNSIFTEIGDDLVRMDDTDTAGQVGGDLQFTYNIFGTPGDVEVHGTQPTEEAALLAQVGNSMNTDPLLSLVSKNVDGEVVVIDPRPAITGGPAWGSELRDGAPTAVGYRGAFGSELWTATWTYASNEGIVQPGFSQLTTPDGIIIVPVTGDELDVVSSSFDGGNFSITFVAEEGNNYKVTQSASLSGPYIDVAGATITDAAVQETISFAVPGGADKYFFRIEKN